MKKLIIAGAGGFGFEVAMVCDAMLRAGLASFESYAFIDDDPTYARERGQQARIIGRIDHHEVDREALYVCAIGNPAQRRYVCKTLRDGGARFTNIIDPSAVVSEHARLGTGVIVCAQAFISCFTSIGDDVHINVMSSIGHDARLEDLVTLSAHVDLTGNVTVEEGAFFGTSACVLPGHTIHAWSRIGAGCAISRSIPAEAIVYCDPPKFLSRGRAR